MIKQHSRATVQSFTGRRSSRTPILPCVDKQFPEECHTET